LKSIIENKIKCPVCGYNVQLSTENASCGKDHHFTIKNGVYQILKPQFKVELEQYLHAFEDFRKPFTDLIDPNWFKDLPFVDFDQEQWNLRKLDMSLIEKLKLKRGKALDVGAWTGWLSNRLVGLGFKVTAVDFFIHHLDGLGANRYFNNKWLSIQMDLNDLSIINQKFDLIIVNRSLQYFINLDKTIQDLISLLNNGGTLLLTGVSYQKNPKSIISHLKTVDESFMGTYQTSLKIVPFKGYLEIDDLNILKRSGINLFLYKQLRLKSMLGHLYHKKPIYYYGVYSKSE